MIGFRLCIKKSTKKKATNALLSRPILNEDCAFGGNIDLDLMHGRSVSFPLAKEKKSDCLNIEQIDHWRILSARRAPCPRLNLLAARLTALDGMAPINWITRAPVIST